MDEPQNNNDAAENDDPKVAKRPRRSSSRKIFPRLAISKVLPLANAIWEEGQGVQVRATAAFSRLGKKHNSGPSKSLIASASSGYGLVAGNASSTYLSLTELGQSIVKNQSDSDRESAILEALFENEVFTAVHKRYLDKALPSDQVVSDFIKSDTDLSDEDSAACWSVISENMKYAGLLIKEGSSDVVISKPRLNSDSKPPLEPKKLDKSEPLPTLAPTMKAEPVSAVSVPFQADFHFNVQIHLPNDAKSEVYDSIFASIANNLLNRKR